WARRREPGSAARSPAARRASAPDRSRPAPPRASDLPASSSRRAAYPLRATVRCIKTCDMSEPKRDVAAILGRLERPPRAVVTAGMPYANGPLHLGHLAGAQLPADIYTRWLGLLIGRENVLYVNGTDDHGSTSEV